MEIIFLIVQLGLKLLVQDVILCINKVTEIKFEQ
jgi:hypothetical protein